MVLYKRVERISGYYMLYDDKGCCCCDSSFRVLFRIEDLDSWNDLFNYVSSSRDICRYYVNQHPEGFLWATMYVCKFLPGGFLWVHQPVSYTEGGGRYGLLYIPYDSDE